MKHLVLLFLFTGLLFSQQVRMKALVTDNTGTKEIDVRPTGGVIIDIQRGLIRTAINGGLRGNPGQIWTVNENGDGQAADLRGVAIVYETNASGQRVPVMVFPEQLKVKTNVFCTPADPFGFVWQVHTDKKIAGIVLYRNGIRQNSEPMMNENGEIVVQPDYAINLENKAVYPNTEKPWSVNGISGADRTDLVTADVFYY